MNWVGMHAMNSSRIESYSFGVTADVDSNIVFMKHFEKVKKKISPKTVK